MLPTFARRGRRPRHQGGAAAGHEVGDRTYKVHLDGYDLMPALKGEAEWPRNEFLYWTDDGNMAALRYDNWKVTFLRQNAPGLGVWQEPFDELRARSCSTCAWTRSSAPRTRTRWAISDWYLERMFLIVPAAAYVGKWLQSFKEFPPRQKPGSFNLERVMEAVAERLAGKPVARRAAAAAEAIMRRGLPARAPTSTIAYASRLRMLRSDRRAARRCDRRRCWPRPTRCRPGTTARPRPRSSTSSRRRPTPASPEFVEPADRIATFDNDGTLWSEQPLYFQFYYILDRAKKLAAADPPGRRPRS